MNDRLLTRSEILFARFPLGGIACMEDVERMLEIQDIKSTSKERRAIGARLEAIADVIGESGEPATGFLILDNAIARLRRGERP